MPGIMIPITMSQGAQRAREDNQADERFAMDQEYNKKRMQGLDMGLRRDQMELDEAEQEAPLRSARRKAAMTSEMAKQAFAMLNSGHPDLGTIPDDQVAPFMAKFLSDVPVFGEAKLMPNGAVSDGEHVIQMDRQTALKMLSGLADPAKAMDLATREEQYINERGQVETMTAGEAKSRGLEMAGDKMAGYQMNKARIEDQYAEDDARLGLDVKRAALASHRRANEREPKKVQFVSPDGKTAKTMDEAKGLEMGWTPIGDYTATRKLQGLGEGDGYDFSKQTPDAIREGVIESTMMEKGYVYEEVMDPESGLYKKRWATQDGKPVPEGEMQDALGLANEALGLLSSGRAENPVDATRKVKGQREAKAIRAKLATKAQQAVAEKRPIVMPNGESKVFTDPQEALEAIMSIYQARKGGQQQ